MGLLEKLSGVPGGAQPAGGCRNGIGLGNGGLFKGEAGGNRGVRPAKAQNWRLKRGKRFFSDQGRNLGTDTTQAVGLMDNHHAAGLAGGGQNG